MSLTSTIDANPLGPRYLIFDGEPTATEIQAMQAGDLAIVNGQIKFKTSTGALTTVGGILSRDVVVTSAQILALNATPVTLVPAPGAGKVLIFEGATIAKPAGAAYAGIAAGEDLSIRYTGSSGLEVGECETTGFLDQTTLQVRHVNPYNAATGISSITPVANAVLVLHMLVGEITTGDSPLNIRVFYRVSPSV